MLSPVQLASESGESLLELCHSFLEGFLLRVFAGTGGLHLLLLVTEAGSDLRLLLRGHLRPDPAGAFDFAANAIVSVYLIGRACVFGGVSDRHG
jgi:hypothetical protein